MTRTNWLPEPTGGAPGAGVHHPGFEHGRKVAMAAREQPGVWLDLSTGRKFKAAHDQVGRVRHRPSVAFRPVGAFEARAEKREDGYAVQVRYIGVPT